MCGVSWACSLAGRFSMPVLLRNRRLADGAGSVAMQPVSASNIGDGGDDLRGHSKAIAPLVPGDVVRDQPEARGQCARPATHSWPGQLSDRLGLAAQVAARHGEAGGVISWAARSRWTKPMWAAGKTGVVGATDEDQVDRRDCGASPRAGHWPDPNEPRRGCGCEEPESRLSKQPWRLARPVRTDGWSAYSGLANQGYDHQPRSISASGDPAHIVMPRVHRVAALLDRWWLGIHHGAIDADHLDYYLDEFTFRFNRRRSQARGLLFFRLLPQAVQHEPVPYKGLVGGHRSLGNQM